METTTTNLEGRSAPSDHTNEVRQSPEFRTEVDALLERNNLTREQIGGEQPKTNSTSFGISYDEVKHIELIPVVSESGNIKRIGFDLMTGILLVEFAGGIFHAYPNTPFSLANEFLATAPSMETSTGKFHYAHIRGRKSLKVTGTVPEFEDDYNVPSADTTPGSTSQQTPPEISNPESVADFSTRIDSELKDIVPEIFEPAADEKHWTDELKEEYERPMIAASENAGVAATAVAAELVPEMGNVLATRQPTAVAYGFPPAVDALIVKAKLSTDQTDHLLKQFKHLFAMSSGVRNRLALVDPQGPEDVKAIAEAKELHVMLRDERLNAEKKKKLIKEPYLRPSQLIDGVFKIWMDEITPMEKEAKAKAEYVENIEKQRKATLGIERLEKLKLFAAQNGFSIDYLGSMNEEAWNLTYQGAMTAHENRKADERRAEELRQAEIREANARAETLRIQNEQLEKERQAAEARELEQKRIADAEREQKEEAERELARQEELRQAEHRRLAAIAEAKRLAPDAEKLTMYFEGIQKYSSDELPTVENEAAKVLLNGFWDQLAMLVNRFAGEAGNLVPNVDTNINASVSTTEIK